MSGAKELLEAISILKAEHESDGSENMRELGSILRPANGDLGQSWFNVHSSFLSTKTLINEILEGIYKRTEAFSNSTIENERMATAAANEFDGLTEEYISALSDISSKYGVNTED